MILEGFRNLGGGVGLKPLNPPPPFGTPLPIDKSNAAHKSWIVCLRVSRVIFPTHISVTSMLYVGGQLTRSSLWMSDHFRTLRHFLTRFTLMSRHHKRVAVDSEFLSGICYSDKNRIKLRISSQDQVSSVVAITHQLTSCTASACVLRHLLYVNHTMPATSYGKTKMLH